MILITDTKHVCYYVQGEQTQAVSSKEADGITAVPDPPAPEEEEEAAPPEADPEAEEGDEPKPEAAAEEKLPAAAKNPDEFPQKDGIIIELSALPSVSSQQNCVEALHRVCCRTGPRQSNVTCLWEAASQSGVTKGICVVKVVNILQSNSCNCMCIPVRLAIDLPLCQPADIKPNPQLSKVFPANHYKTAACTGQVTTGSKAAWQPSPNTASLTKQMQA